MIERYPLQWPDGWKRTALGYRRHATFNRKETALNGLGATYQKSKRLSIGDAIARVFEELQKLGVKHVNEDAVVSTNLRVNMSGIPRGDQGEPSDPGVAVYWERKGVRQCMAIDQYYRVADNLAAVAATLDAMRAIERHGGAQILERAFLGFAQLPAHATQNWREALGFPANGVVTLNEVESAFNTRARKAHPDLPGGSEDAMRELIEARNLARKELGAA